MLKNKKPASVLETVALGYLFIPVVIFMLSWLKIWISVPAVLLILIALYKVLFDKKSGDGGSGIRITPSFVLYSVICFALILLLSYFLGIGGFTEQPYDATKHNFILKDLIDNPWPVRLGTSGNNGLLCYYIAGYIVPALAGKLFSGFEAASLFSVIWHAAGIYIAVLILYKSLSENKGKDKPVYLLYIFLVIMLFAPFNAIMQFLCICIYPDQPIPAIHWISDSINVSFSSHLTSLRYVYPQFVPTLIVIALMFRMRKRYDKWALIVSPLIAFSAFSFIGAVELMLILFILDQIKDKEIKQSFRSILSIENLSGVISAVLFLLYLSGNIMQPKPESARIGLGLVEYGKFPLVLILQELSWGLWIIFLLNANKKEPLLWAASICLFIFPFIEMGRFNDLCTRGSMPALVCLCILLIRQLLSILERSQKRLIPLTVLILALLLSGAFFIPEEFHLPDSTQGLFTPQYNWWDFDNSLEFYTMNDWTRYQYISWEENPVCDFILR